jgi:hypothetical protein
MRVDPVSWLGRLFDFDISISILNYLSVFTCESSWMEYQISIHHRLILRRI